VNEWEAASNYSWNNAEKGVGVHGNTRTMVQGLRNNFGKKREGGPTTSLKTSCRVSKTKVKRCIRFSVMINWCA